MNILIISVRSDFGGGPKHINQLIENLPENINIFMAYPKEGDPYSAIWDNNIRIKNIIYIPYRKFSISYLLKLKSFIIKNQIDIIHSHGNGAGVYSRALKLIGCKVKVIHTFHGISDKYTSIIKYVLNIISGRFLKYFTDDFILVSHGEFKSGKKKKILFESKSTIIYNGIKKKSYNKSNPKDIINIVTISRFDYQKNMQLAYDIAYIFKNNSKIKFTWIGDGEDLPILKYKAKLNNVNIDFIGFTTEPLDYLSKGDIYLSTSRFEGLPYALIEAASLSLPIIASDVVGNNECVINKFNGFLFKSLNEAVECINICINNPTLLNNMSEASYQHYENNFTISKMIKKLTIIYSKYNVD